jgi:peptidoglycan/LPS O-acetylase OafA/YrhL
MSSTSLPGRIPTLDGFRALAVIFVIASHAGLERFVPGQFGVTLFFFLSGYLITTLIRHEFEDTGKFSFSAFYLRRAIRILPPMYITIAFAVALSAMGLIRKINFEFIPIDLLFLTNYFPESAIPIGLWSLAIEEHFYLLFPLSLLLLCRQLSFPACAAILSAVCLAVLGVRIWEVWRLEDFANVNFWTHTRIDSILFGCVLALYNNPVIDSEDRLPKQWHAYFLGGFLLIVSFIIRDEIFRQTLRYTIQGVALILIFNAAIRDRVWAHPALENAFFRFVALHSYTLYLVHVIMFMLCEPLAGQFGRPFAVICAICASTLFCLAMNRGVERPLRLWSRRFEAPIRNIKWGNEVPR